MIWGRYAQWKLFFLGLLYILGPLQPASQVPVARGEQADHLRQAAVSVRAGAVAAKTGTEGMGNDRENKWRWWTCFREQYYKYIYIYVVIFSSGDPWYFFTQCKKTYPTCSDSEELVGYGYQMPHLGKTHQPVYVGYTFIIFFRIYIIISMRIHIHMYVICLYTYKFIHA